MKTRRELLHAGWMLPMALVARPNQEQPPFRTSIDAVRLDVLVLEGTRPVAGLTARDFDVTDRGERQAIRVERVADLPLDVILAVDTSSSVSGDLLRQLVTGVRTLVTALDPTDRAALVTFSHVVAPRSGFDAPRSQLLQAIDALEAAGNTSVIDAVSVALTTAERDRPTLVLVFSDGVDTASWLEPRQVFEQARAGHVVIEAVVVGDLRPGEVSRVSAFDRRHELDDVEAFVSAIATQTGGRVLDGERGTRLGDAFVDALAAFRQRYQITFTPTVDTPGWHPLEVRVPRRARAIVRARSGYQR